MAAIAYRKHGAHLPTACIEEIPNISYIAADVLLNVYSLVKYQVVTFSASVDFPTVSICCKIPYIF